MRKPIVLAVLGVTTLLFGSMVTIPQASAASLPTEKQCKKAKNLDQVTQGWCVAITRKKGNCLACHAIEVKGWPKDLPAAGNIGPPLVSMKDRYKDRAKLRAQVWDSTVANPETVMPPFGRNKILTETEIDRIVDFLLTI
ncbi:MAG TPA: sulfur oxidation c-type cytochrome SoxX [Gammaproteobacteria bacterium]|nr:sulfur oxidation c-type cytochrome SoxX [Gammaproteobacteria bacterium]